MVRHLDRGHVPPPGAQLGDERAARGAVAPARGIVQHRQVEDGRGSGQRQGHVAALVAEERQAAPAHLGRHRPVASGADHLRQVVEADRPRPVQAQRRLRGEDPAHRGVDAGLGQRPPLDRPPETGERRRVVGRVHDDVVPGRHRRHRGPARRHFVRDAAHAHRVGVHEPVEAQLVAQQAADHRRADGGGPNRARVETGQGDVGSHDRPRPGRDARPERRQLDPVEARPGMRDERQPAVRVDVGVAVPGKVLEGGHHAARLQAAHPGRGEARHHRRVLAERARVDDRVAGVVVDVGDRREVDVHAEGPRLDRGDAPRLERQPLVARRPERHRPRERGAAAQAEPDPGLEVGRVQQRQGREGLKPVVDGRPRHRLSQRRPRVARVEQHVGGGVAPAEHQEPARVLLAHQGREPVELRAVGAEIGGPERRHDELADLLVEGHPGQGRLDPPGRLGLELGGRAGGQDRRGEQAGGRGEEPGSGARGRPGTPRRPWSRRARRQRRIRGTGRRRRTPSRPCSRRARW